MARTVLDTRQVRQTVTVDSADPCPCGTGATYGGCCEPLHRGERQADTPEQLMRSRYTAFAVGDADYLWRTWHPRTRPTVVDVDPSLRWTGLEIIEAAGDEVEFVATYRGRDQRTGRAREEQSGFVRERSRFAVRARRWFYLDGVMFG
jgi:SEC-C motif domain protein